MTQMEPFDITDRALDSERANNAETASDGYAAGGNRAWRLAQHWRTQKQGYGWATQLIGQITLAHRWARECSRFGQEYDGIPEPAEPSAIYLAAWDLGFGATLIAEAMKIRDNGPDGWLY